MATGTKFVQRVMDHTGDTRHEFDPANAAEVATAMARFTELTGEKKYSAAKRRPDGQLEKVRAFDPSEQETVFHPPLQGG